MQEILALLIMAAAAGWLVRRIVFSLRGRSAGNKGCDNCG
jgi:hypothetical protein